METISKSHPKKTAPEKAAPKTMTREEMVKKMLADQQLIREARQRGVSFQELREKYGFEFATV